MLMPLFLRFPRLWFDSQLKSSLFPDKLLGSTDFFPPLFPSCKTLSRSPLNHGDFISTMLQQPFLGDFLPALLYHGAAPQHPQLGTPRLLQRWQRNTNFTAGLTYTVTAVYHKRAGSLLPTPTLAETDWWGSLRRALPSPLPACRLPL